MRKYTLRYTREEVVAGTEIRTGSLVRCSVTIEAESQNAALREFQEDYAGSDARLTSVTPHPVVRKDDGLSPTQRSRAYFGGTK